MTAKRQKATHVAPNQRGHITDAKEWFFTHRDALVGLLVPRLLTEDNVNGLVDVEHLSGVCRRTRELLKDQPDLLTVRVWELHRDTTDDYAFSVRDMVLQTAKSGEAGAFRHLLEIMYQETLPMWPDGADTSFEQAWDQEEQRGSFTPWKQARGQCMAVMRDVAWIAGQRGHLAIIRAMARVGSKCY